MTAQLPESAQEDIAYVKRWFLPMDEPSRALVERGILPRATYVLPDGTAIVPADHAQLLHEAGGDPDALAADFRARFAFAGGDPQAADREYQLGGRASMEPVWTPPVPKRSSPSPP
jgi:hypothetical protein